MAERVAVALTGLPCASIPFHPLEEDQGAAGGLGSILLLGSVNA